MTGVAALDHRSLTLPDWRTALKKRIKKPKRPDRRAIIRFFIGLWIALLIGNIAHLPSPQAVAGIVVDLYFIGLNIYDYKIHPRRAGSRNFGLWLIGLAAATFVIFLPS